ncbi:MAG TPA: hypothetical protein VD999_07555 [Vitreimonas sp.]|nr:hypothetical protein [Vitreimonas sp.]
MICNVEGCNKKARAKGLCRSHYMKQYRYGDPLAPKPKHRYKGTYNEIGHNYKDGRTAHPLYYRWKAMIRRCNDPNDASYWSYGGRGITVCEEWENDFWQFATDMGPCPGGFVLDRIDNSDGYKPSNCRWTDRITSSNNQRGRNE